MITNEYDILAAKKGADVHSYWLAVDLLMAAERDVSVTRASDAEAVDKLRTNVYAKDPAVIAARLAVNVAYTKLWEAEKRQ